MGTEVRVKPHHFLDQPDRLLRLRFADIRQHMSQDVNGVDIVRFQFVALPRVGERFLVAFLPDLDVGQEHVGSVVGRVHRADLLRDLDGLPQFFLALRPGF